MQLYLSIVSYFKYLSGFIAQPLITKYFLNCRKPFSFENFAGMCIFGYYKIIPHPIAGRASEVAAASPSRVVAAFRAGGYWNTAHGGIYNLEPASVTTIDLLAMYISNGKRVCHRGDVKL